MSQIDRSGLAPRYWEHKSPGALSQKEWEALCDGCGKCCLNKLEDEETGEVALTRVACRLLDDATCLCAQYEIRHQFIPECIVLSPENIDTHAYWMPRTCAYRLLADGGDLPDWHPLLTGDPASVARARVPVAAPVPEWEVDEEDYEDRILERTI